MLQKEFEALTGKKVTAEEYAEIEKVYMAIDNMDKEEFCAAWNEQKFGYIVGELVKSVCAVCGGSGGGKPDSAMGGGTEVSKVDDALAAVDDLILSKLGLWRRYRKIRRCC